MTALVLTDFSASISELKRDPMGTVESCDGGVLAVLNRNTPSFYCVPAKVYEALMERLEDLELNALAEKRKGEKRHRVSLEDL